MLKDTGGYAGGQSSTTIISGISQGEIEFKDALSVEWKEARVSLCCGVILSLTNFIKMLLLDQASMAVAITVCLTLIVTVFCAKSVGCLLPILAKKLGLDPAVMANPIVTTIVDAISLLVYFGFATMLMGL